MFKPTTARDCLRGGFLGALAATAFSGALATALISTAPSISPTLSAAHVPVTGAAAVGAATPHPTITLSPTSGPVGTVVTITGKGFVPPPAIMGEAGDQFKYGNPPSAGGAPVSKKGIFKSTLKVTSTDRKGHNVIEVMEEYMCGTSVCTTTATAPFDITK